MRTTDGVTGDTSASTTDGAPDQHSAGPLRQRVLDVADEVFALKGISSVSMAEIAAAIGISKRALLAQFPSKDELVLALMDRHVRQRLDLALTAFNATLDTVASDDGTDPDAEPRGRLGTAWREVGNSLTATTRAEDAAWQHLLFDYAGQARRNPALRAALARRRQEHLAAAAAQIAEATRERHFELPISPHELAVTILALSTGLALEAGIDPTAVPTTLLGRLLALVTAEPAAPAPPPRPAEPDPGAITASG